MAITGYIYASSTGWSLPVWILTAVAACYYYSLDSPWIALLLWAHLANWYFGLCLVFRAEWMDIVLAHYFSLGSFLLWGTVVLAYLSTRMPSWLSEIEYYGDRGRQHKRSGRTIEDWELGHTRLDGELDAYRLACAIVVLGWWYILQLLVNLVLVSTRVAASPVRPRHVATLAEVEAPQDAQLEKHEAASALLPRPAAV